MQKYTKILKLEIKQKYRTYKTDRHKIQQTQRLQKTQQIQNIQQNTTIQNMRKIQHIRNTHGKYKADKPRIHQIQ